MHFLNCDDFLTSNPPGRCRESFGRVTFGGPGPCPELGAGAFKPYKHAAGARGTVADVLKDAMGSQPVG